MGTLIPQALRDEYANAYLALSAFKTPDPVLAKRQQRVLSIGRWVGRAVQTGEILPAKFLNSALAFLTPQGVARGTIETVMRAWVQAARQIMAGSGQLSGLEVTANAAPWLLAAAGLGWVWYARKKKHKTRSLHRRG